MRRPLDQNDPAKLDHNAARRDAFRDLMRLLSLVGKPAWATPTLIILGLISSFAETLGITLILLFLYSITGHMGNTGNGLIGEALKRAGAWFGSSAELSMMILLLIIARGALAMLYNRISSGVAERISEQARNLIHRQYLSVSYGFIQRHEQAQLIEILGTESWIVASAYASFTRLIINACSILVFSVFLLVISWKIMAVAIVGSITISALLRFFAAPARDLGQRVKRLHQVLGEHMLMTLQGLRTIRAYGQEPAHEQRFVHSSSEARIATLALSRLSSWIGPLTEIGYLAILCVIIAGANWWHTSFAITLGTVALLYRLQPHMGELENNFLYFAQIQPQLRSVREMMETHDKEYPPEGHIPIRAMKGGIAFQNVSFRYQDEGALVLNDVSFDIPAGVTTALIGASGAGKTTIVNMLLRLYQPTSGKITVDGVAIDALRRTDWVSLIGVAGQDVDLVEGTVIDNIKMADIGASEPDILEAARSAGVAEFVEILPDGYETWIGQEGLRFSGGQRQRIGLARAFLRDPQLLILDEAMSALDGELQSRIRHAIENRMAARTILLITHRLETIRNVEHVIWIENGKVRAEGPPAIMLRQAEAVLGSSN